MLFTEKKFEINSLGYRIYLGINFSNGATFVIRCKPDKAVSAGNGDWTRIFNFYKHASSAPNDGEGEVYLTQGLIGTWYYNAQSVQYLDTSVAGTLTANQWHTVALVIEPIKPDNTHVKVSVFVDYRTIGSTQGFLQAPIGSIKSIKTGSGPADLTTTISRVWSKIFEFTTRLCPIVN